MRSCKEGYTQAAAAARSGFSERTGRRIGTDPVLPSQRDRTRRYRTRQDPFAEVWREELVARSNRPQRWRASVAELVRLQAEYSAWLEAIPEALKASATAEALEAILNLDLDELSAVELPRGFGRD